MCAIGSFLFCLMMHVTYFMLFYCALTLFYDNALLPTAKVRYHSHFVYLFVIMTCFLSRIILVSIDFLIIATLVSPFLVETRF